MRLGVVVPCEVARVEMLYRGVHAIFEASLASKGNPDFFFCLGSVYDRCDN